MENLLTEVVFLVKIVLETLVVETADGVMVFLVTVTVVIVVVMIVVVVTLQKYLVLVGITVEAYLVPFFLPEIKQNPPMPYLNCTSFAKSIESIHHKL